MISLILPFYRNMQMLRRQVQEWESYPRDISIVLVDDGSPEPAVDVIENCASLPLRKQLQIYRIGKDLPWNRNGARNLGATVAETKWIVHVDIDHLLPAECAARLLDVTVDDRFWYRFPRYRVGRADETRKKDAIPADQKFGKIKPHGDSYLCTRELYWKAGGYSEEFTGALGGGSPFLQIMEKEAPVKILPEDVHLHVYTRDVVEDASDWSLSRDTSEYTRRKKAMQRTGTLRGKNPLRFPWSRVL